MARGGSQVAGRGLVWVAMTFAVPVGWGQASAPVQAGAAAAKLPEYDVVSIKPNHSGSGSVDVDSTNDRCVATNISVKKLLQDAYDIKEDLISGVQGPVDEARFDVIAKMTEPDPVAVRKLSHKQRGAMLLPFLVERFQLEAHVETRTLPVYELVVMQGGQKFKPTAEDKKHGHSMSTHGNNGSSEMTADNVSMTDLSKALANYVHRPVIDKTGFVGSYDFSLKWSNEGDSEAHPDAAPVIFTALPEQLGLKLQPAKGSVETLVVDHVEMPSEN
jgi:uncharacterized protein (TIGR03435 family)